MPTLLHEEANIEADFQVHHHHGASSGNELNRTALSATIHCLTGCAIGEVLGLAIGTALGWGTAPTVVLAVILAFLFGYALNMLPLIRSGVPFGTALGLALAADTAFITVMEVTDNLIMLAIPGAMDTGLTSPLFWASLAAAMLIAGVLAFPLNRWLISRGQSHAVVHSFHGNRS